MLYSWQGITLGIVFQVLHLNQEAKLFEGLSLFLTEGYLSWKPITHEI
jgi:hypothetical protein